MAINVSTLTEYVDEQRLPLISKAVLGSKSAKLFNLQTGVKYKSKINLLSTAVTFGDGSTCGFNAAGTSTLSQREIEAGLVKVNMEFCDKDLLPTWAQHEVKVAAGAKSLPFEQEFIDGVLAGTNANLEKAIWQGDTASLDANLKAFDGLIKILDAEASVIELAPSIPPTTVSEALKLVYMAIPVEVLEGASIVVGMDTYRTYVMELTEKNLFYYNPVVDAANELVMPGSTTKVIGVPGLNGTKRIFAMDLAKNVFYGTDMENDQEKFIFKQDEKQGNHYLIINFNAGVQVAFPDQVVSYEMA